MLKCQTARNKVIDRPKKSSCEDFIEYLDKNLSEMPDTSELIRLGVFPSAVSASNNRKKGNCPEYFQINKRMYRYPKKSVLEWVRSKWVCKKLAA